MPNLKSMFVLHPQLEKDSVLIKDLNLCQVRLMNNALYPWLILIPKKENLVEIIDLEKEDQILLMEEIDLISKIMKKLFKPDKLNIAALGNMVPQLHIHIIARFKNDLTFPKPVWVSSESKAYDEKEISQIMQTIRLMIS